MDVGGDGAWRSRSMQLISASLKHELEAMPRTKSTPLAAPSYMDLQRQITELQTHAEAVRKQEFAEVIGRIREAIKAYGFTPADLFPEEGPRKKHRVASKQVSVGAGATKAAAKYRDPASGRTWTGNGKRPAWFVAAVQAGAAPESLAV